MKYLNFCFVFVSLCVVFDKSHGTELNCVFKDVTYVGNYYTCYESSLVNTNNDIVITGYLGTHLTNKTDTDVKSIWIHDTNTKYIPTNLGLLFNLNGLVMYKTQLVKIKTQDFIEMQDLRMIDLSFNPLQEIPNGAFSNNLQLEWISLWGSKIKFLGSSLFDELMKLNTVFLQGNICIKREYKGNTAINKLKNDIKIKCKNPNELQPTTTPIPTEAPTTTTQNPLEVKQNKINKLEQELLEQQKKNTIELAKVQQELRAAKSDQQKEHDEVTRLEQKNADLSTKLSIALDDQQLQQEDMTKLKNIITKLEEEVKTPKVIELSHELTLNCEFKYEEFVLNIFYSCEVTTLNINNNDTIITGHSGVHNLFKYDTDVRAIHIHDTNTKFIPENLGLVFSLTSLVIEKTQLIEIKTKDFIGMRNLEELNLSQNKLTSVPIGVFSTLTRLKSLNLGENEIEEIPNGVFANNLQLNDISLYMNKIKFLGSSLFQGPLKLNRVELNYNICIDKTYEGSHGIFQLKNDIRTQCKIPNEITKITTQNPAATDL